ncbi:MAG: YegP family protein [Thermodesulfobacteriota bacterium]
MPGHISITTTRQDNYHFLFRSTDGAPLLTGEPRTSKAKALEDAETLRRCVLEDGCYAVARDAQGRFYFHLMGDRGEILGVSATYPTPEGLGKAIADLKACAPRAVVIDRS